jgi:hypothetical protein
MSNSNGGRPPRETPDYGDLAERTKLWARDMNCERITYHNDDGVKVTEVVGHFVKFSSADPGKPIWSKAFPDLDIDLNRDDWHEMMKVCRARNILIAYHHGKGWFIGNAKDVGKTIASRMNHSTTHLQNSVEEITYAQYEAPQGLTSGYKGHVNGKVGLRLATSNIKKMLKSVGIAVKKVIVTDYLPTTTNKSDE